MALLGNIIKQGIELSANFPTGQEDIQSQQIKQLKGLLDSARDTSFGLYHGFSHLLESSDPRGAFAREVPVFDYHRMDEEWWKQQQKYPNITWPGKPSYFALSSGTTGKKSKRIPVTEDMLSSMRKVGIDLVKDLSSFDLPATLFEKEVFVLSSSADLNSNIHGFKEGEISGINVHNFPGWYDFFYRPGKEIAEIDDWDTRLSKIVREAPSWDIGSIVGIPSWILIILRAIIDEYDLSSIHDIWPDLTLYSTGGVAFDPYEEPFKKITSKPLTIIDTYLASEGFFGYRSGPDSMHMKMAFNHNIYYEFIPFDDRGFDSMGNLLDQPKIHYWEEVEENQDYALLISTCAGAWRYMIGDTIRFSSKKDGLFKITGRTKFFLNVVGSQLSEEKINDAIQKLSKKINNPITEFSVAALKNKNDEYYHQWILATDDGKASKDVTADLDSILQEINKNYAVARSKALKDVKVIVITKEKYHQFLEAQKKKGGQVKTPKVMSSEKMRKFLKFIKSE